MELPSEPKRPDQTFADYLQNRPSLAILAMVTGLSMSEEERGFRILMLSYGGAVDGICVGCAATAAIYACDHERGNPDLFHSRRLARGNMFSRTFSENDLVEFENAIDNVRLKLFRCLRRYMGVQHSEAFSIVLKLHDSELAPLSSEYTPSELAAWRGFAEALYIQGL
jgi:hypothetical protein